MTRFVHSFVLLLTGPAPSLLELIYIWGSCYYLVQWHEIRNPQVSKMYEACYLCCRAIASK